MNCYGQSKFPNKSDVQIKAMVQTRVGKGGILRGREWKDIVSFMYHDDTGQTIIHEIVKLKFKKVRNRTHKDSG